MFPRSLLANLKSSFGTYRPEEVGHADVYHVSKPHAFVQAAGYLKHVLPKTMKNTVLYRGQPEIYGCHLVPTLYRSAESQKVKSKQDKALGEYLSKIGSKKVLAPVGEYAWEPLLQHYGIKTRWLDLVDNAWVALWFACHEANRSRDLGKYVHFSRRHPSLDPRKPSYAYIILVRADLVPSDPAQPGLFAGPGTDLIDLRVAAPSTFLRPHAQHALLFKRSTGLDHEHTDYSDFVVGVIRVNLVDALDWLGDGSLLSAHSLFPPPAYDFGYHDLLEHAPTGNAAIGTIHQICP
jgi:hypothetical protein